MNDVPFGGREAEFGTLRTFLADGRRARRRAGGHRRRLAPAVAGRLGRTHRALTPQRRGVPYDTNATRTGGRRGTPVGVDRSAASAALAANARSPRRELRSLTPVSYTHLTLPTKA